MAVLDKPASPRRPPMRVAGRPALRLGRFSVVWRPRSVLVLAIGTAVLVLAMAVNIGRGEFPISVGEVLAVLLGGGEQAQQFIILELRLPRSLTGALVGAALAVAGAITQSIARNPLASPDLIGFTAGASAAAVFVIVLGGGFGTVGAVFAAAGLPVAALVGGLVTATAIYLLAWRRGVQGFRLVLVGIGIHAMLIAVVHWLLVVAEVFEAARAYVWLNGSLNARGWEHVVPVAVALAVLVPAALLLAHVLGGLQFGDDTARGLGIPVDRARTGLLFVAVGLASVATAAAGPIAFVALVAPQIALRLVGSARPPIAASLVIGASLTVVADLIARSAFGATELPVGIVTAVLGAPYLLFLLARHGRRARA
ncbi:FecCD family ABC transporter permease [Pseudonocardia nigra]|uniref:FecCD family ABC transporter permease n=1 Tax=Pseudonocardia nigra TaxID=1921578 RepID=UPI001FE52F50|nr:iron chelate uptake ABC transporter family permease subunit [Pseudonocardia nigra]